MTRWIKVLFDKLRTNGMIGCRRQKMYGPQRKLYTKTTDTLHTAIDRVGDTIYVKVVYKHATGTIVEYLVGHTNDLTKLKVMNREVQAAVPITEAYRRFNKYPIGSLVRVK